MAVGATAPQAPRAPPPENPMGTAGWGEAGNSIPEELQSQSLEKARLFYGKDGRGPPRDELKGTDRARLCPGQNLPLIQVTLGKDASVCSLIQCG